MNMFLYRLAQTAASHGQLERFIRTLHALTGGRLALQPVRADDPRRR